MKAMLKHLLFCSLFLIFHAHAFSKGCYDELRSEGIRLAQRNDYKSAVEKFAAARFCQDKPANDDLDKLINQALTAREDQLLKALNDAQRATQVAIQASKAEAQARQQAEENARIAEVRGKEAEGLRLALIAENERLGGDKKDAFLLSYLSLQLVPADSLGSALYVFGKAVRDSFATTIARSTVPFCHVEILSDTLYLAQLDNGQVQLISPMRTLSFQTKAAGRTNAIFSKLNNWIIICDSIAIHIYDLNANLLKTLQQHQESITFATLSLDEMQLLTGSRDNSAVLWDLSTGIGTALAQHQGNIYAGVFSTDNEHILLRSSDATASLWNRAGKFLHFIGKNEIYLHTATFSPKNLLILTAAASGSARLWNQAGEALYEMPHTNTVKKASFSPDGKRIVTLDLNSQTYLWDEKGNRLAQLGGMDNPVSTAAWSPNASTIVAGFKNGEIQLRDHNGNLIKLLAIEENAIQSVLFSADGKYLLTVTQDGNCKVWDEQGILLMDIALKTNNPITTFFTANSKSIFTLEDNNLTLRRYPLPTVVFQTTQLSQIIKNADYQRLKREYRIQFIAEK